MKMSRRQFAGLATGLFAAQWAVAEEENWHRVGDFKAGGDAKTASIKRSCDVCLIKAVDGRVTIESIVVRRGGKDSTVKLGATLGKGDQREVSLGGSGIVDTLVVKDSGTGRYFVFVK